MGGSRGRRCQRCLSSARKRFRWHSRPCRPKSRSSMKWWTFPDSSLVPYVSILAVWRQEVQEVQEVQRIMRLVAGPRQGTRSDFGGLFTAWESPNWLVPRAVSRSRTHHRNWHAVASPLVARTGGPIWHCRARPIQQIWHCRARPIQRALKGNLLIIKTNLAVLAAGAVFPSIRDGSDPGP